VKVLVVDPSLFSGPYDAAFCAALAAAGAEAQLVTRPPRPHEAPPAAGFTYRALFYRRAERRRETAGALGQALKGLEHGRGLVALDALVRRERPDVVHVQWLVLPLLDDLAYARLARRVPLVLTLHNSVAFHGRPSSALQLLGHERALRRFQHHVAHTRQTADYLRGLGVPAERISLLPHPPLELPPAEAAPPQDGIVRILLFGALKPYKGIEVLARAGIALAARRRDFHVTIAGRPFYDLAPLQAEIAAAGAAERFSFDTRFVPDAELACHLARADIVAFPYHEIDASGALALAVRAGRPIVASAVGVFAEPPAAEHLRLVPPGDAAALAGALEELIADPAARRRQAAASRALEAAIPGWPAFARACLEIYRKLDGRPGAASGLAAERGREAASRG
jgi:glycosyltransferase involved in cell wall biosynthesis